MEQGDHRRPQDRIRRLTEQGERRSGRARDHTEGVAVHLADVWAGHDRGRQRRRGDGLTRSRHEDGHRRHFRLPDLDQVQVGHLAVAQSDRPARAPANARLGGRGAEQAHVGHGEELDERAGLERCVAVGRDPDVVEGGGRVGEVPGRVEDPDRTLRVAAQQLLEDGDALGEVEGEVRGSRRRHAYPSASAGEELTFGPG
jgi:hypothetical protein